MEPWRYGIRVNEMAPGPVVTEMHYAKADDPDATKRELEEEVLPEDWSIMRRYGSPDEVAPAVAFLASDDARFITGSTVHVVFVPGTTMVFALVPPQMLARTSTAIKVEESAASIGTAAVSILLTIHASAGLVSAFAASFGWMIALLILAAVPALLLARGERFVGAR